MADLQADFDAAVANSKKLSQRPDNATLLKIYGLYKQATVGDVTEKKRLDPAVLARAQESVSARAATPATTPADASSTVPYDRAAAQAAVEIFLKDHADAEGFSRKLAKKIHQEKN